MLKNTYIEIDGNSVESLKRNSEIQVNFNINHPLSQNVCGWKRIKSYHLTSANIFSVIERHRIKEYFIKKSHFKKLNLKLKIPPFLYGKNEICMRH